MNLSMSSIAFFLNNRINPLLLRELRQQVRNRFTIVLINLFIAALVFSCMMTVLFRDPHELSGSGIMLFYWLAGQMTFACFLVVVGYTAVTTANERLNGDLMYVSGMRPSSIVFGKALSGAVLTILLMSITLPFVTLAYLLRGLDIEIVVRSFLSAFVSIQVMNALAITLFSNVKTRSQMILMIFGGFFASIFILQGASIMLFMVFPVFRSGSFSAWTDIISLILIPGSFYALFLAAAIAAVAPPTSNRFLPIRITLTVIYIGSLSLVSAIPNLFGPLPASVGGSPLAPWAYAWLVALVGLTMIVVSERDTWSYRVRRTIPKSFLLRLFCFPFYSGSPCGLVWLAFLCLGVVVALLSISTGTGPSSTNLFPMFWLVFALDYCLTGMLLRSWLLPRSVPSDKTWAVVLFLLLLFTFGGMLLFFLTRSESAMYGDFTAQYAASWISALNPFYLDFDASHTPRQTYGAAVWAVALIPFVFFWFIWRVRFFSPNAIEGTLTLEQAREAVLENNAKTAKPKDATA